MCVSPLRTNASQDSSAAIPRRRFLGGTAAAVASFTVLPGRVLGLDGQPPASQRLNIAGIGVGGMGRSNLKQCSGENIVALCDVDQEYAAKTYQEYPQAKVYRDFRELLDKQKDIDAVIVATPDHTHAVSRWPRSAPASTSMSRSPSPIRCSRLAC